MKMVNCILIEWKIYYCAKPIQRCINRAFLCHHQLTIANQSSSHRRPAPPVQGEQVKRWSIIEFLVFC